MNVVAVKRAVRTGTKVIFHVTGPINIFRLEATALEFVENRAVGFAHHIRKDRQTATVGHANDDVAHTQSTTSFDDLLHRRDQAFAAIKAETFGAHVFHMQEFFETFGLNHLVQDRFAPFT